MPTTSLKTNIQTVLTSLNQGLVERDTVLKMALLTVLAGENILLIGPPGTAKSLIARRIADVLTPTDNSHRYFEYLLTKFSTPDEIFGPLSIAALKADCVKRNTAGYLPTVRMAFLDEIFKASSSILNALLTILNERLYHNGAELQRVPMQALIAASNELPTGQDELSALYDRFLVRVFVGYVQPDNLPLLFAKTTEPTPFKAFDAEDLAVIKKAADEVTIPPQIVEAVQQIWQKHHDMFKEDNREQLSDRRLKKIIKLLRVSAVTNGRAEVDLSDVLLLKDCLWNHYDNALKVREMIKGVLQGFSYAVPLKKELIANHHKPVSSQVSSPKNVIKGYKGSGTQHDPILISTYQDIAGLERPDVGQKGYYFKQTADIDCSSLTTWPNIDFCGHYDGGGYSVIYQKKEEEESFFWRRLSASVIFLFDKIKEKSSISNLILHSMFLAKNAYGTDITACSSVDCSLVETATNCNITVCQSGYNIVSNSATRCRIIRCQSGLSLISNTATACVIEDCSINLEVTHSKSSDLIFSGVSIHLTQGSSVKNCFVDGLLKIEQGGDNIRFSGIVRSCEASSIKNCALGTLKREGKGYIYLEGSIAYEVREASTLQNNITLDRNISLSGSDKGKPISAALFTQHYFEHTLNWNFDTVWQWNSSENRPELQSVGVGAVIDGVKKASTNNSTTGDLLTQQIRANMWL